MAGRGREMTMPAWMTAENNAIPPPQDSAATAPAAGEQSNGYDSRYADANYERSSRSSRKSDRRERSRSKSGSSRHRSSRNRSRSRESGRHRSRSRDRSSRRRGSSRDRDRSSSRRGHGETSRQMGRDRSPSPVEQPKKWVSRRKNKPSNFDVKPPEGGELPPIGGVGANPGIPMEGGLGVSMQQTRHARRLYVGGVPATVNEAEISVFFRDVIKRALSPADSDGRDPVVSVYINREKCFAFVELTSIELTTACCQLDGLQYNGNTLRIRRPNDYRPDMMPKHLGPTPQLDLSALGIVSTTVADGPNKVFVGGLPYDLGEDDIKELLRAFGPLKSFHLVKEAGSNISKGYAFCEYMDPANTNVACIGLNNLSIRDKTLTVRVATQHTTPTLPSSASAATIASIYGPGAGAGTGGPLAITSQQHYQQHMDISNETPTRVLVLENMVEAHELQIDSEYRDILEDVQEECSQYGAVMQVVIPRECDRFPKAAEGSVFVEFRDAESAKKAALALRGRKFADRVVVARYFDEVKFSNRELC